jgi:hypothetical protein
MKRLFLYSSLFLLLFSCKKEELIIHPEPNVGTLKFEVICNGTALDQAEIEIYTQLSSTKQLLLTGYTNGAGIIQFQNLVPATYTWRIRYPNATSFIDLQSGGVIVNKDGANKVPVSVSGNCR